MKCKFRVNFVLKATFLLKFEVAPKCLQSYKTLLPFFPKAFFNLFIYFGLLRLF